MKILNKNGVTLIELLLVISLISIVTIPLFSLFITYTNTFNIEDFELELQQHGQFAIDFVSDIIIQSRNISYIEENINESTIKTISFIDNDNKVHTFRISNNSLKYGNTEVANYIKNISIKLIPSKLKLNEFKDAIGVKIIINLSKNKENYRINNAIYFRNN